MKIKSNINEETGIGDWSLTEEEYEVIVAKSRKSLPNPKSSHIKSTPFIDAIKSGLNKVTESMLPLFQRIKGSREKVSFYTYADVCDDTRQIWENYKHIFRTTNQVHSLQHYLGAQVLQYILIVNKGIPCPFSQRIKDQEPVRNFEGKLERIREELKHVSDRVQSKLIDEEKLEKEKRYWMNSFEDNDQKIIVAKFIDYLDSIGEFSGKAASRVASQKFRKLEAEARGIKEV
jgi:hypothetical protein